MTSRGMRALNALSTPSYSIPRVLCLSSSRVILPSTQKATRTFTTTLTRPQDDASLVTAPLNPRWLSDVKSRIGKCISFGLTTPQTRTAGLILSELAKDWKSLLAGSEGYLTSKHRTGIYSAAIDWGSQDTMGHVNNVQYVRYCETSRTNWTRQIGEHFDPANRRLWEEMLTSKSYGLILRSIKVDYKFPMTWPDRISVYHKLRSMPGEEDSAMLLDVLIVSEGRQRAAAKAEEDVVVYDYKGGRKSRLPGYMLKQFQRIFREQEEAKRERGGRVRRILEEVRALEKESWDRPDAKEDLGSAT